MIISAFIEKLRPFLYSAGVGSREFDLCHEETVG